MGEVFDAGNAHQRIDRVLKKGVFRSHDQVTHPSKHKPTRDAGPLHHSDGRLRDIAPAATHAQILFLLPRVEQLRRRLVRVRRQHQALFKFMMKIAARCPDVMPGGEMLAIAGQHNAAHGIIFDCPVKSIVQRIGHLPILRVVEGGPIHRDPSDVIDHFIKDRRLCLVIDVDVLGCNQIAHVQPLLSSPVGRADCL